MEEQQTERPLPPPYVPSKKPYTEFPLIDNDPHFKRVCRYARPSDYAYGAAMACVPPGLMVYWETVSPSYVGKGGFAPIMRLAAPNRPFYMVTRFLKQISGRCVRFYGVTENKREYDMDMREMVDRVKAGEPLYGKTELTDYMQGVAHRNSRYTGTFLYVVPWFNFVNHNQHGIDTAKYYRQAELELEAERLAKKTDWTQDSSSNKA